MTEHGRHKMDYHHHQQRGKREEKAAAFIAAASFNTKILGEFGWLLLK